MMTAKQKGLSLLFLTLALVLALLYVSGTSAHGTTAQTMLSQHATSENLGAPQHVASSKTHPVQHGSYNVVGKPTITANFINRVLSVSGSPVAGAGQTLYALGVEYEIDPAFALAFFQHESSFGKFGEATTTLSLGNLRCIPNVACVNTAGKPCQPKQSCYALFSTWEAGFKAWYALIRDLYVNQWHLTTIEQIIPTYAPTADHNDEVAYIGSVEHAIDLWREGKVME